MGQRAPAASSGPAPWNIAADRNRGKMLRVSSPFSNGFPALGDAPRAPALPPQRFQRPVFRAWQSSTPCPARGPEAGNHPFVQYPEFSSSGCQPAGSCPFNGPNTLPLKTQTVPLTADGRPGPGGPADSRAVIAGSSWPDPAAGGARRSFGREKDLI